MEGGELEVNQVTCVLYQLSYPSPTKTKSPHGMLDVLLAWNLVVNYIWLSNSDKLACALCLLAFQ